MKNDSVDCHGPPVSLSASVPGHICEYNPYPMRITVVASAKGRIASPTRGFQLFPSEFMRLRVGNPAEEADLIGRLAATAGTRSFGTEVPAVTRLPLPGSKVNS